MSATAFQRRRRELAKQLAKQKVEVQTVEYTYEQLNDMKVPEIKEVLESKEIDYKSSDNKQDLIAYLVDVPEEVQDEKGEEPQQPVDGDDNVESD